MTAGQEEYDIMITEYTEYRFDMLAREIEDWIDNFAHGEYTYAFRERKKKELLIEINDTVFDREEEDTAEFIAQSEPEQRSDPEYVSEIRHQVKMEIKELADNLRYIIDGCI